MAEIVGERVLAGQAIVDYDEKVFPDFQAEPGQKAYVFMHTVPFEGSVGIVNMLTATRLARKGFDTHVVLFGPASLMASATRGFPNVGDEAFPGHLNYNNQLKTIMSEGGHIYACRFSAAALYGMREVDMMEGVRPVHPRDIVDAALQAWKEGAFVMNLESVVEGAPAVRTPPAAFTIPGMAQRLEEAAGRWRAAEQRLYPIVILWPEGYERYLSLIRAVADELRSIRTAEGLADAYAGGVELASSVALREALPTEGLELELAMGAACCLRYREVCAEMRREEAARRVGEARAQRREWVMVDEPRPWQDAVIPPYRRMDMHLPEGTGFHVWVEQSPDQAGLEYGVEVVQLDPTTGEWLAQDPVLERRTFSERGAWEEAVEALKARWEGPEAQP